jgi:DNA-binding MurR/RpiR family transcriptional regulator
MASPLQDKILELHDQLTESERRLAEVTLECIGNLAAYSATELAQKAGVSKATAGRFFRRLGYENFNEVRALVRDESDRGSPLYELAGVQPPVSSDAPFAAHLANDLQNLAQTFDRLDPADVERAISLLVGASRICVAGFRNGRVLAQYAWALLTQLRGGITLVPGAGLNLAEDLADLGDSDVLLVMDFRRRVTLLRPMVEHANRVGAKVVILTDPSATELPARSDVVLRCVNHGAAGFDSYVAAISLINHLGTSLALALGDAARHRLEEIESLHDHYGDLHR